MKKLYIALVGFMFFLPSVSNAHVVSGDGGFISGLSHPILGFDHLLAMLSVGVLSAQMGGKAIWKIPVTFVIVMLAGGILGMEGVKMISVELGIALSVLVLGLSITIEKKLPAVITMMFVGFFAIFHGFAHGIEMPYLAKPVFYVFGFVVGTTGIHIVGVLAGLFFRKIKDGQQLLRYLGSAIAGIGFYLIAV